MAKDASFDIVSEFDKQELVNAIDQVKRELTTRFDLKDSNSNIEIVRINNGSLYPHMEIPEKITSIIEDYIA